MGLLSWLMRRMLRLVVDLAVLTLVFVLLPGLPPKVTYNNYEMLPPSLPLEGALAGNKKLNNVQRILDGKIVGPESIAARGTEEIFVSLHGGKILRLWGPRFDHFKSVASIGPGCDGPWQEDICGRPLGLRFAPDGKLLVADAYFGLFSVDVDTGEKESLFDVKQEIEGAMPMLPDDLDVDKDGNIYWSDASTASHLSDSVIEMLSDPSGRLIKYDPKTGTNTVLARNIHFANGVQLSPDHDFVLFSETFKFRILRHWLSGPKAGETEIFVDRLPGYPDNIRARNDGGYYISLVSLPSESNRQLASALGSLPFVRKLLLRILVLTKLIFEGVNSIFPNQYIEKMASKTLHLEPVSEMNLKESNLTIVVEVDAAGKIVDSLQGDSGKIVQISETQKVGDNLFFGSPYNKYLGRIDLSPPSMEVEGKGVRMKVEKEENADELGDDKPSEEKVDQPTKEAEKEDSQEVELKKETKEKQIHEEVKTDFTKEEL
ncbi:adipocyte plasma membrane-associated protein Hemomucin-like isoform X2 [Eriocheir sinensis]|nr:adipocyte plasma membrane-associated protein Hemomucin-like isoform X2 [Eriocheir sinensis]XP_050738952.1 adipocyte plasma membrane-associated protein Hemomucin-like isoform X2 [Eriocheir sinensis]